MAAMILISLQPAGVIFALLLYICQIRTHVHLFAILCVCVCLCGWSICPCGAWQMCNCHRRTTTRTCLLPGRNANAFHLPLSKFQLSPALQIQFAPLMAEKLILIKIALSSLALIYVKPPMSGSGT